jgi:hypothetical protein
MAATTLPNSVDIPIVVHAYVTDPKLVGYQMLTNYESTYWAPVVGNEAWRLYEVLRSFCHQGNNTCHPSINLLLAILGLKDRSVLIGRSKPKTVQGKDYYYPGLIQTLQNHDLVVAEVVGEGPKMRYIFHVHVTPGLLTNQQLSQLPALLQKKHAELLARCVEDQRKLEAKKRPPKMSDETDLGTVLLVENKGIGNSNTPLGNSNTPSWNFQDKQQPYNTTQITGVRTRKDNNNSSGEIDVKNDVVVALLCHHGIAQKVAHRLEQHYNQDRIEEKIAFLEFLLDERPEEVKKPAAWLRRAIEDNYSAPDGFASKAERERREQEEEREARQYDELTRQTQQMQQAKREAEAAKRANYLQHIRDKFGTTDDDIEFWTKSQQELRCTTSPHIFDLIADAQILKCTEDTVLIGVEREARWRQLQHPGTVHAIKRALNYVAGRLMELEVINMQEMQEASLERAVSSST